MRDWRVLDERKGLPDVGGDGPLIPRPELTLLALWHAVAVVAPSRLPEFFEDVQKAFVRAGDEDSVVPIRMFYRQWAVVVEIERHPETARRLRLAERDIDSPDPEVRATEAYYDTDVKVSLGDPLPLPEPYPTLDTSPFLRS